MRTINADKNVFYGTFVFPFELASIECVFGRWVKNIWEEEKGNSDEN